VEFLGSGISFGVKFSRGLCNSAQLPLILRTHIFGFLELSLNNGKTILLDEIFAKADMPTSFSGDGKHQLEVSSLSLGNHLPALLALTAIMKYT
jgi:hypothetical protein